MFNPIEFILHVAAKIILSKLDDVIPLLRMCITFQCAESKIQTS